MCLRVSSLFFVCSSSIHTTQKTKLVSTAQSDCVLRWWESRLVSCTQIFYTFLVFPLYTLYEEYKCSLMFFLGSDARTCSSIIPFSNLKDIFDIFEKSIHGTPWRLTGRLVRAEIDDTRNACVTLVFCRRRERSNTSHHVPQHQTPAFASELSEPRRGITCYTIPVRKRKKKEKLENNNIN